MTDDPILSFRKNNELVGAARGILEHPTMQRMLLLVKDANPPLDAPVGSPEVASVRLLSQSVGYNTAITTLLSLSVPHSDLPDIGEETWGADTEPQQP